MTLRSRHAGSPSSLPQVLVLPPRHLPIRLQETSEDADPPLPPFHFQRLLANLTALRVRTRPSPSGQ